MVLEYLEAVKRKEKIPAVSEEDERLHLIFEETEEDSFDFDEDAGLSDQNMNEIRTILNSKTKSQLIALILDAAEDHPDIVSELMVQREMDTIDVTRVVARLKKEIKKIGIEPGWQDYWNHEGYTPDYSNVRTQLKQLLAMGHADELLALGDQIIKTGTKQVEMTDDEGETAVEIGLCMPYIIDALKQSSRSIPDRLLWAVDVSMNDSYGMFDLADEFLHEAFSQKDWSTVADRLLEKLKNKLRII